MICYSHYHPIHCCQLKLISKCFECYAYLIYLQVFKRTYLHMLKRRGHRPAPSWSSIHQLRRTFWRASQGPTQQRRRWAEVEEEGEEKEEERRADLRIKQAWLFSLDFFLFLSLPCTSMLAWVYRRNKREAHTVFLCFCCCSFCARFRKISLLGCVDEGDCGEWRKVKSLESDTDDDGDLTKKCSVNVGGWCGGWVLGDERLEGGSEDGDVTSPPGGWWWLSSCL